MAINETPLIVTWPPHYVLKKHPRAKYIRFRASYRNGLELIVPSRFNLKKIPDLLDQNRAWIEKQLLNLQVRYDPAMENLPEQVEFQAVNLVWALHYLPAASRLQLLVRPNQELVLVGKIEDKAACKKKLLAWIKTQAKEHLLAQLEQASVETGLFYQAARIRDQSSRWGSCSAQKTISLNYKLLFLPPALMRHTLVHELCHTVHLNHAEKFWQLVAKHDPNWQENRRAIRKAAAQLPVWLTIR